MPISTNSSAESGEESSSSELLQPVEGSWVRRSAALLGTCAALVGLYGLASSMPAAPKAAVRSGDFVQQQAMTCIKCYPAITSQGACTPHMDNKWTTCTADKPYWYVAGGGCSASCSGAGSGGGAAPSATLLDCSKGCTANGKTFTCNPPTIYYDPSKGLCASSAVSGGGAPASAATVSPAPTTVKASIAPASTTAKVSTAPASTTKGASTPKGATTAAHAGTTGKTSTAKPGSATTPAATAACATDTGKQCGLIQSCPGANLDGKCGLLNNYKCICKQGFYVNATGQCDSKGADKCKK